MLLFASRNSLAAALATALCIAPSAVYAQVAYSFNLPAQPLADSLRSVGSRAGVNVAFNPSVVKGKSAKALRGTYTVEEALNLLTERSGLLVRKTDGGTFLIESIQAKAVADLESSDKEQIAQAANEPLRKNTQTTDYESSTGDRLNTRASTLDAIVVTGSRLPRLGGESSSPVTVLGRDDIERSGGATVRDVLRSIPQASVSPSENDGFMGAAPVQLRGLNIGTTLVLVNGRRIAPSGANGRAPDIGAIPLAAVEGIEIMTDGASAIYGSDAIGGIINVLLKDGKEGVEVDIRYGAAEGGKASETQFSLTTGHTGERFRTTFALDALDREQLIFADRSPTNDMDFRRFGGTDYRVPYTNQGTVYSLDGSNLPGLSSSFAAIPQVQGALTLTDFIATQGTQSVGGDYYSGRQLQPSTKRYGLLSNTSIYITDNVEAKIEVLASENRGNFVVVTPFVHSGVTIGASNPLNPFGVDVGVNRILTGVAPDVLESVNRFHSVALGLSGASGRGWKWNAALLSTGDDSRVRESNVLDFGAISAAIDNQTINLFATGPIASADILESLLPNGERRYRAREYGMEAGLTGEAAQLAAGPVLLALGLDARRSDLDQKGMYENNSSERSTYALYGEALVPLTKELKLTAAGRLDHYGDFGSTTNPKFGIEWEPASKLRLRASYGTSFKAPSLYDLAGVPYAVPVSFNDPARGGETVVAEMLAGGSDNLKPERAETFNAGIAYGFEWPSAHIVLDISIDQWKVRHSSVIVSPDGQTLVDNESFFPDRVTRGPQTPADIALGQPGAIQQVNASSINFGTSDVSGTDLRVRSTKSLRNGGHITFDADVTHVDKFFAELAPGATENRRGNYSYEGYAPEWKGSGRIGYSRDSLQASLSMRHIASYRYYGQPVEAASYYDTSITYHPFSKHSRKAVNAFALTVGALNLFDRTPPFMDGRYGFDSMQADNRGRFIYVKLSSTF